MLRLILILLKIKIIISSSVSGTNQTDPRHFVLGRDVYEKCQVFGFKKLLIGKLEIFFLHQHARAFSQIEMLVTKMVVWVCVCVCVYRHTAACVAVAMVVLHPGPPRADGQSAEETQSEPLGRSGRWVHEFSQFNELLWFIDCTIREENDSASAGLFCICNIIVSVFCPNSLHFLSH